MISVKRLAGGQFAVIDGMHRVTALQQLEGEKYQDIDYATVHLRIPTP